MPSTTERAGWLLKRAQAALNTAMSAALSEHGASVPEYAVLTALADEPGMSNADLARRAYVTPQTMNQVLRELERRGWVRRRPHPEHGRIRPAELTGAGYDMLAGCHRSVGVVEERMLAGLSAAGRDQLVAGLKSCVDGLSGPVSRA